MPVLVISDCGCAPPGTEAPSVRWMGRWWWHERKSERADQLWECAKCGTALPFWDGARNGISRSVEQCRKAVALGVPRTSRAAGVRVVCVSNVIYQNLYLIRLINVSAFLSN